MRALHLGITLLIFLGIALGATLSSQWHSLSEITKTRFLAIQLERYDYAVPVNEQACFSAIIKSNWRDEAYANTLILVNDSVMKAERLELYNHEPKFARFEACVPPHALKDGENVIKILIKGREFKQDKSVFFHVVKDLRIKNKRTIKLGANTSVDEELNNSKKYLALTQSEYKESAAQKNNMLMQHLVAILGITLLILLVILILTITAEGKNVVKDFALTFALLFSLLTFNGFLLDLAGIFNRTAILYLILAETMLASVWIAYRHRGKLRTLHRAFKKALSTRPAEIVAIITTHCSRLFVTYTGLALFILLFLMFGFHLLSQSHYSFFNVYYERITNMAIAEQSMPRFDPLSYLGRPLTFFPGYFYLEGTLGHLTGLQHTPLFALMLGFSTIFLFFAALMFAESIGVNRNLRGLFFVMIVSSGFVFSTVTVTPRHATTLAMILVACALVVKHARPWMGGLIAGAATLIQLPAALFYWLLNIVFVKKRNLGNIMKASAITLVFAGVFFLWFVSIFGPPKQAKPTTWGYLIKMPPLVLLADQGLLLLAFLSMLVVTLTFLRPARINGMHRRVLVASFVFLVAELTVSSRLNILASIFTASFVTLSFQKLKDAYPRASTRRVLLKLVQLHVFVGAVLALLLISVSTINAPELDAIEYMKNRSAADARVLADPMLGHAITYLAKRPVLADLMAEYAPERKLDDAYRFLQEQDYTILEKYNISYVFTAKWHIFSKILPGKQGKGVEFEKLDKLYDNGFTVIHYVNRKLPESKEATEKEPTYFYPHSTQQTRML
jgi:hypothetical protein